MHETRYFISIEKSTGTYIDIQKLAELVNLAAQRKSNVVDVIIDHNDNKRNGTPWVKMLMRMDGDEPEADGILTWDCDELAIFGEEVIAVNSYVKQGALKVIIYHPDRTNRRSLPDCFDLQHDPFPHLSIKRESIQNSN